MPIDGDATTGVDPTAAAAGTDADGRMPRPRSGHPPRNGGAPPRPDLDLDGRHAGPVLSVHGLTASLRDPRLLEESTSIAADLDEAVLTAFLDRLGRAGVLLAGNVGPELILDDLALAWPQRADAAA